MTGLNTTFRRFKHRRRLARARTELAARPTDQEDHGLDTPLVVTLTSFPPRYGHLAQTLQCLLTQSTRPDQVVLWIAQEDKHTLPDSVRALTSAELSITTCDNHRSYKKILPALQNFPDATLVTADDDAYYDRDWLARLVSAHRKSGAAVVSHRAHRILLNDDGLPQNYCDWDMNTDRPGRSGLIFPTGVSGVLYAPGAFHADVRDLDQIQRLCPVADDVWLYWMHRLIGGEAEKIGGRVRILEWQLEPQTSLRAQNLGQGGNDRQIAAMIAEYGWPPL